MLTVTLAAVHNAVLGLSSLRLSLPSARHASACSLLSFMPPCGLLLQSRSSLLPLAACLAPLLLLLPSLRVSASVKLTHGLKSSLALLAFAPHYRAPPHAPRPLRALCCRPCTGERLTPPTLLSASVSVASPATPLSLPLHLALGPAPLYLSLSLTLPPFSFVSPLSSLLQLLHSLATSRHHRRFTALLPSLASRPLPFYSRFHFALSHPLIFFFLLSLLLPYACLTLIFLFSSGHLLPAAATPAFLEPLLLSPLPHKSSSCQPPASLEPLTHTTY